MKRMGRFERNLSDGDPNFMLTQVALNDAIMLFAFAPAARRRA